MDYSALRGQIRAKYKTQADFAVAMGMDPSSLSQKLNGKTEWSAAEIRKACELLSIDPADIPKYFFCPQC
jgi:transcriptional regulator with XRE-family HTH domain